jgi:hypothetical protein
LSAISRYDGVKGGLLMAKRMTLAVVVSLAAALLSGPAVSTPRAKPPRTVLDYYMLLPDSYFEIDRRKLITSEYGGIVDIRNGYIKTGCDGAQVCWTMCLFKRPDGPHLIALSNNNASDGPWEPWLGFRTYQNGRWVDVTKATLPRQFSEKLGYQLPRYGTTIEVITEAGKPIYHLVWMNGKFQVKRAPR